MINENLFVTRRRRLITEEKQSKAGEPGENKTRREEGRKSACDGGGRRAPQWVGTRHVLITSRMVGLSRKVEEKSNNWKGLTGEGAEGGKEDAKEEGGIIALERKKGGRRGRK